MLLDESIARFLEASDVTGGNEIVGMSIPSSFSSVSDSFGARVSDSRVKWQCLGGSGRVWQETDIMSG
jgi:hypothetical protein